jgi:hypothetical protein
VAKIGTASELDFPRQSREGRQGKNVFTLRPLRSLREAMNK